eukprot:6178493-Alexandrium_andersonii.AAC.1
MSRSPNRQWSDGGSSTHRLSRVGAFVVTQFFSVGVAAARMLTHEHAREGRSCDLVLDAV